MREPGNSRPGALNARHVRRRFDRVATTFGGADFVHRRAAEGMLERMAPMQADPRLILDAGSASGAASRTLAARFRRSRVISLDSSLAMLRQAKRLRSRFGRLREVQGDARQLPFRTGSIDLVFANMLLPWIDDGPAFFQDVARILRVGGLFVFSALGPDSLREIRDAWRAADGGEHVNMFPDMHDVGDGLGQSGLLEPVLDVDYLTVTYDNLTSLFADLTAAGARNCLSGRRKTLTGRRLFETLRHSLEERIRDGRLSLPLELVFGHAWGGGPRAAPGEYAFDVAAIGRRRR